MPPAPPGRVLHDARGTTSVLDFSPVIFRAANPAAECGWTIPSLDQGDRPWQRESVGGDWISVQADDDSWLADDARASLRHLTGVGSTTYNGRQSLGERVLMDAAHGTLISVGCSSRIVPVVNAAPRCSLLWRRISARSTRPLC